MSDRRDRTRRLRKLTRVLDDADDRALDRDEIRDALYENGLTPSDEVVDMLDEHQRTEIEGGVSPGCAATALDSLAFVVGSMTDEQRRESARFMARFVVEREFVRAVMLSLTPEQAVEFARSTAT